MAGITDKCFRKLCFEKGCSAATTEMISAQGFITAKKTIAAYGALIDRFDSESVLSAQIFGTEPADRFADHGCILEGDEDAG